MENKPPEYKFLYKFDFEKAKLPEKSLMMP